jgi:hypothetical protein
MRPLSNGCACAVCIYSWRYAPHTRQWALMPGGSIFFNQAAVFGARGYWNYSLTTPGARESSATAVTDAGRLVLYGGVRYVNLPCADMFMYDTSLNRWSWTAGVQTVPIQPNYTQGVTSSFNGRFNGPGSRYGAVAWWWAGKFFLFGGDSLITSYTYRNDMSVLHYHPIISTSLFSAASLTDPLPLFHACCV